MCNGSSDAPMNTKGNMLELKPDTHEQRKLIKATMRLLK